MLSKFDSIASLPDVKVTLIVNTVSDYIEDHCSDQTRSEQRNTEFELFNMIDDCIDLVTQ